MSIKVLQPGVLTTVQDLGRYAYQDVGMPVNGAMDPEACRLANKLVGNHNDEAVLECTLIGGSYEFCQDTCFAITGADMPALLNHTPCIRGRAYLAGKGDVLTLQMARSGCRSYLAIYGGFTVPPVMGSRSTNLKAGIGGYCGRALQAGDLLPTAKAPVPPGGLPDLHCSQPDYPSSVLLHVIEGSQATRFTASGLQSFYGEPYRVSEQSDRMGCRMDGPAITSINGTDILSDGIAFGSIQVTPAGQPIILMADRQTTGGYAKIGTVCSTDLAAVAQCRPGTTVHFRKISVQDAQKLLLAKEERFHEL